MFYSGNPKNPTEYNPAYNVGESSDSNTLKPIEISEIFTQSVVSGERTINGVSVPVLSGVRLNITGPDPSYIHGPINSVLTLAGGAQIADGSSTHPSLSFINDNDTGLYRSGDGTVAVSSNGTTAMSIGTNIETQVPITTPAGQNLVLNPGGPSIDFTNHTLINVAGISIDPNYITIISPTVVTTNATPVTGLIIGTDINYAYAVEIHVVLANATDSTSSGAMFLQTKGKNIGGVTSVITPYIILNQSLDPGLAWCTISTTVSGQNIIVVITGLVSVTINWRLTAVITRQSF